MTLAFKKYKFETKPRFQNVIQLGKRGRNYLEVWEEEVMNELINMKIVCKSVI